MLLCSSYSNAQVLDYTTGNLTNFSGSPTTTTSNWNNGVYVNQLCFGAGQSGNCGPTPSIRADSGNINFSYGLTNLNQVVNAAAAVPSNALNITGFTYSFTAKNGNGWDDGRLDTLSAYVKLYDKTNTSLLENYNYDLNQKFNWTTFNYNETFTTPRAITTVGNAQYGFIGKDNNFWAGNYGPEIMNVNFALKYSVDPCKSNPAFSSTCAGFSDLVISKNLYTQSYGINQALAAAGSDIKISGLNYGYALYVGGTWCSVAMPGGTSGDCARWSPSSMKVDVGVTSNTGTSLYSAVHEHYEQDTFGNYSYTYLFPTQRTPTSMGNFSISPRQYGTGAMYSNWSNWIYTPDKCVIDPLSSSTCPGYAVAYAKNLLLGSTVSSASAPAAATLYSTTNANTGAPINNGQTPPPTGAPDPMQTAQGPAPAGQPPQQQGQQGPAPQQGQGPAPDPNQNPSVAQMDPAQPSPQQPGPAPTQPQPAGGPPQVAQQSAPPPSSSGPAPTSGGGPVKNNDGPKMTTTQALSIIKSVQEKDKATQQIALQNAAKIVEGSTQQSQSTVTSTIASLTEMSATSAAAAAQFSSQTTQASMQVATQVNQSQQSAQSSTQTTGQSFQNIQSTQSSTQTNQYNSGTGITVNSGSFGFNSNNIGLTINTNQQAQTSTIYQSRIVQRQSEVETPIQVASFNGIGRAGNPLSEMMMQQRFEMMQSNIEQRGSSVNRNVQPNDLAGSVDVASMATQPKGFELYSFIIKDSTFYEPKEVYKGQKVIDNVQVLRQMSSDRLHQEMVNQQYK